MDPHELAPTSLATWKALAAAVGVGVLITMAALTRTYQTSAVGTSSDNWRADTTLTVTSPPAPPSFAPSSNPPIAKTTLRTHGPDGCAIPSSRVRGELPQWRRRWAGPTLFGVSHPGANNSSNRQSYAMKAQGWLQLSSTSPQPPCITGVPLLRPLHQPRRVAVSP